MNIWWAKDIEHEIREAVTRLRESGEDHIELPYYGIMVLRVDGQLYRKIEEEMSGFLLPIEDEIQFVVSI